MAGSAASSGANQFFGLKRYGRSIFPAFRTNADRELGAGKGE